MRVTVLPYDARWPEQFQVVKARLRRALSGVDVVAIEHVGSTAVPGLAAKPILDIDVVVRAVQVRPAIDALVADGSTYEGERGIPDRHALDARDEPARHVYVCVDGSLALRNHLGVRDVLRADDRLRREYGALKQALAEQPVEDIDQYIAAKSDLLQQILRRAGLTDTERAVIAASNPSA